MLFVDLWRWAFESLWSASYQLSFPGRANYLPAFRCWLARIEHIRKLLPQLSGLHFRLLACAVGTCTVEPFPLSDRHRDGREVLLHNAECK